MNKLDNIAKIHDYAYQKEHDEYLIDHDKQKHLKNIIKADEEFIRDAKLQKDDVIMGNISSKIISAKKNLESNGILNSATFSGLGIQEKNSDPTAKLKKLVEETYKKETKNNNNNKIIKGGNPALLAIALPAIGALLGKVLTDAYSAIKSKITGKGMNHKTNIEKIDFMKTLVKNL